MRISDWSSDVCSSDLGVTDEQGFSLTPLKLKYLFFSKEESNLVKIYFDELNFVALSKEAFTLKYPQVYLTLNTLTQVRHEYSGYRFSRDTIYEQYDSYIYFSYNETRTLFSYNKHGRAACRERVCQYV